MNQGLYAEAREVCTPLLSGIDRDPRHRAATLTLLARIERVDGDPHRSASLFDEALEAHRAAGDSWGQRTALARLITLRLNEWRCEDAARLAEEFCALALRDGDVKHLVVAHGLRGQANWLLGDWRDALDAFTSTRTLAQKLGMRKSKIMATAYEVQIRSDWQHRDHEALTLLDQIAGDLTEAGSREMTQLIARTHARLSWKLGDDALLRKSAQLAMHHVRLDDPPSVKIRQYATAAQYLAGIDLPVAMRALGQATELLPHLQEHHHEARVRWHLAAGWVSLCRGQRDAAQEHARAAEKGEEHGPLGAYRGRLVKELQDALTRTA